MIVASGLVPGYSVSVNVTGPGCKSLLFKNNKKSNLTSHQSNPGQAHFLFCSFLLLSCPSYFLLSDRKKEKSYKKNRPNFQSFWAQPAGYSYPLCFFLSSPTSPTSMRDIVQSRFVLLFTCTGCRHELFKVKQKIQRRAARRYWRTRRVISFLPVYLI